MFSYNNTDFSLSERKNLIDLSDEVLCLNRCNYSNYDIKTLRTICLCDTRDYFYYPGYIYSKEINSNKNHLNGTSIIDEFSKSFSQIEI